MTDQDIVYVTHEGGNLEHPPANNPLYAAPVSATPIRTTNPAAGGVQHEAPKVEKPKRGIEGQGGTYAKYSNPKLDQESCDFTPFTMPYGGLRFIQLVLAIISFATIDDFVFKKEFSEFKFLLAMGIMTMIYTIPMILIRFFKASDSIPFFTHLQIALDGLFFLLCIMSACLAAKKCDEKTEQIAAASSFEVCKFDGDDARTSIAFMFFTSFAFAFSIYYSVQEYRGVPPGGWFCIYPCYDLFDIPRPGQKNESQQSSV